MGDSVDMIGFDFRAGTAGLVVTRTRIVRISIVVGVLEVEPNCFLCEDVVDPVVNARVPTVKVQIITVYVLVKIVVHREKKSKRDEFIGERVEPGTWGARRRTRTARNRR